MKISISKPSQEAVEKLNLTSWGTWECPPSTFDWQYSDTETCYIIEGKAVVTTSDEEVEFSKGDLVVFPKGLSCTWKVVDHIKKYYNFG
ncbi:cupin domain-containing protein [Chlamydiota bacterium]